MILSLLQNNFGETGMGKPRDKSEKEREMAETLENVASSITSIKRLLSSINRDKFDDELEKDLINYAIGLLGTLTDGRQGSTIAPILGVSPPTVTKWRNGSMRPILENAIKIISIAGENMADVLDRLGYEGLSKLMRVYDEESTSVAQFLDLLTSSDPEVKAKAKLDLDFLHKRLIKN